MMEGLERKDNGRIILGNNDYKSVKKKRRNIGMVLKN